MSCIDYSPNGTNIDKHGLNRADKYSPREEVNEDAKLRDEYYEQLAEKNAELVGIIKHNMGGVAVSATELNSGEHAAQGELFPKSWVTGQ